MKTKPNDPCPCLSGKKFKKCCRGWIMKDIEKEAPEIFRKHQITAKAMLNQFAENYTKICDWPVLLTNNTHIKTVYDVAAYMPVAIHPIHYIHGLATTYAVHKPGPYPPYDPKFKQFKLTENEVEVEGVDVSVSSNRNIDEPHLGHLIPYSQYDGNVMRYHAGMYAVIYISTRRIAHGELIKYGPRDAYAAAKFASNPFHEHFKTHVTEIVDRFKILQRMSETFSDVEKTQFGKYAKALQQLENAKKEHGVEMQKKN